jgi:hypothetical protein
VHYVLAEHDLPETQKHCVGRHRPAIVVNAWPELNRPDGYANLTVFPDHANDGIAGGVIWATSRFHSELKEPGTWHWPEKA